MLGCSRLCLCSGAPQNEALGTSQRQSKKAKRSHGDGKKRDKLASEKVRNDPSLYCRYFFKVWHKRVCAAVHNDVWRQCTWG